MTDRPAFTLEHPTAEPPRRARRTAPAAAEQVEHARGFDDPDQGRETYRGRGGKVRTYTPPKPYDPVEAGKRLAAERAAMRSAHLRYYGVTETGDREAEDAQVREVAARWRWWFVARTLDDGVHLAIVHRSQLPHDDPRYAVGDDRYETPADAGPSNAIPPWLAALT